MKTNEVFQPVLTAEELRGFARTVAEIEWLLLILVLLYQLVLSPDEVTAASLAMAMFFFAAFVLSFHYANFYSKESHWKLVAETLVMIVFITWVLFYTGGAASPLNDLYLLVVIVSALTLGKAITLLELGLIAACYVWLGYPQRNTLSLPFGTTLVAQIAPMLLVAYITTMLSADIRRAFGHMKLLSETDELTGVLNMRAFGAVAERVFRQAERYARPFSVLIVDSDHLKTVNDTLGHEAGDRLLKLTVQCIQSQLRQTDVVARYGGDEFVVLLPDTSSNGAVGVAERIRKSIESSPLTTRDKKVTATVSIGIAGYPNQGHDLETVQERADHATYASKNGGKNRITLFST
ncbi:MAG: GGDEF domain-containing protein [Betaproteobacteria bacterium]|nr:GGDEF domain-containing protein [Betaproteobacteria bacterium]MDH3436389.1 GGDEF domain-containing protein [Betaproteobacteria bacterium]